MAWLITGGAGYIGAHVVREMLASGRQVVVLDDLSTGRADRVPAEVPLIKGAIGNRSAVKKAFAEHEITGVMHLAARKQVGESVERPLYYWSQNIGGLQVLLEEMVVAGVHQIVYSSSAAVYGQPALRRTRPPEGAGNNPSTPMRLVRGVGGLPSTAAARIGRMAGGTPPTAPPVPQAPRGRTGAKPPAGRGRPASATRPAPGAGRGPGAPPRPGSSGRTGSPVRLAPGGGRVPNTGGDQPGVGRPRAALPRITENTPCDPINPYGATKLAGEWMVAASAAANGWKALSLRYFNVAGAGSPDLGDPAALNLIPMVLEALDQARRPTIFGDDYPTPDGTCIRDYIHVADLAAAHVAAARVVEAAHAAALAQAETAARVRSANELVTQAASRAEEVTGRLPGGLIALEGAALARESAILALEGAKRAKEGASRAVEGAGRAMEEATHAMEDAARVMEDAARKVEAATRLPLHPVTPDAATKAVELAAARLPGALRSAHAGADRNPQTSGVVAEVTSQLSSLMARMTGADDGPKLVDHLAVNIGTGRGYSVSEVIDSLRASVGTDFVVDVVERRAGDPPALVADPERAARLLGWRAKHTLRDMTDSAWAAWQVKPTTE